MKQLNILYITQYYPPDYGAPPIRAYELVSRLATLGHKITVLCEIPNYPDGKIKPGYKGKFLVRERDRQIEIFRVWSYPTSRKFLFSRLLNYVIFCIHGIWLGTRLRQRVYNLVYASSPPPLVGIAGLILAKIHGIPFIYEVRDLWFSNTLLKEFKGEKLIFSIASYLNSLCAQKAKKIITVTEGFKRVLSVKRCGGRITTVRNGVNTLIFKPSAENGLKERLGLKEKFVVIHAGMLGYMQDADILLQTFLILNKLGHHNIVLLTVGDGVKKDQFMNRVKELNLRNVVILPGCSPPKLASLINCADLGIVVRVPDPLETTTIPAKIFPYMACGKPVLLRNTGESQTLLEESGGGIVVKEVNPSLLASAILDFYRHPEKCREMGQRARIYAECKLSWEIKAKELYKFLETFA